MFFILWMKFRFFFLHNSFFLFVLAFGYCCVLPLFIVVHCQCKFCLVIDTHIIRLNDAFKEIGHKKHTFDLIALCLLLKHTRSNRGRALHKIRWTIESLTEDLVCECECASFMPHRFSFCFICFTYFFFLTSIHCFRISEEGVRSVAYKMLMEICQMP